MVLLKSLGRYKDAKIVRTRDENVLKDADVVVDVGGVYKASAHRYDHHQSSFDLTFYSLPFDDIENADRVVETMKKSRKTLGVTKLSSAGLIYRHFGIEILKDRFGITSADQLLKLFFVIYHGFIESIDAIDNGVEMCGNSGTLLYKDTSNLSSRVNRLYPVWNQEDIPEQEDRLYRLDDEYKDPQLVISGGDDGELLGFRKSFALIDKEFDLYIKSLIFSWLPGQEIVDKAMKERFDIHKSGRVIKLSRFVPFQAHIYDLETAMDIPDIYFVLYPDLKPHIVGWRLYCLQIPDSGFTSRLPLLKKWRGLKGSNLGQIVCAGGATDLDDFIHCHHTGFISGVKTLDAAMLMIEQTLAEEAGNTTNGA